MSDHCTECGMLIEPAGAYHPYAACLMFRGCPDGSVVTANLNAVRAHAAQYDSGFDDMADRNAALQAELAAVKAELAETKTFRAWAKNQRTVALIERCNNFEKAYRAACMPEPSPRAANRRGEP